MRLNYTDDEEYPGQFALWQGNCTRSLRSKAGQAALTRLEAALLALPEKKLIKGKLVNSREEVCAIGALAKAEGKLPHPEYFTNDDEDDEDDTAYFATDNLDIPKLVAWKVVEQNDIQIDGEYRTCEGPEKPYDGYGQSRYRNKGVWTFFPVTDEERYTRMLAWVRSQLQATASGS